jgi:hypothetical protein
MKDKFESEEIFTAYATIDAGYAMILKIDEEIDKPKNPVVAAIDRTTGFDKTIIQEKAKQLVVILEDIIEAKKIIEADFTSDETALLAIKKTYKI